MNLNRNIVKEKTGITPGTTSEFSGCGGYVVAGCVGGCAGAAALPAGCARYHKVAPAPRGLQFKLRPANANTVSRRPLSHRTAELQHAIVFTCERVARPFSHAVWSCFGTWMQNRTTLLTRDTCKESAPVGNSEILLQVSLSISFFFLLGSAIVCTCELTSEIDNFASMLLSKRPTPPWKECRSVFGRLRHWVRSAKSIRRLCVGVPQRHGFSTCLQQHFMHVVKVTALTVFVNIQWTSL